MSVPIIIPVYGHLDYAGRCLENIWLNTKPDTYYIVLVDDAGKEPVTTDWLRGLNGYSDSNPPSLFTHERNKGYTGAVNTGIRYALSTLHNWDFLVLLNTDTEVQPGWLEAFRETVENANNVGVVGAKLLSLDTPDQIIHGGTMDLLGTHKGGLESQGHCAKRTDEVWVTFACVALTKEVLIQCGLLDSKFRNFASDSDYSVNARLRGFRVIYQPKCRVYHKQSATVSEVVDMRSLAEDQQRLISKYGGEFFRELVKELPFGISRNIQR